MRLIKLKLGLNPLIRKPEDLPSHMHAFCVRSFVER